MKKWFIVVLLLVLVVAAYFIFFSGSSQNQNPVNDNSNSQTQMTDNTNSQDQNQQVNNSSQQTQNTNSTPQQISINIKGFAFSPSTIVIKAGDTITWTNNDSAAHTVTSDSGSELDSPSISQGQTYSHTFNTQGVYLYHCSIHTSMKGKIIVQ